MARKGPELLAKIRDQYGFKVASEDYRDVIDAGVDIVVVASPTGLHHEHAKAALEAGAHVMCEKPVTIDPAEAWDLVETAKRLDRELIISFGWNYLPMMKQAKQLMEDVGIGKLEHLMIHMQSVTRELLSNTGAYPGAAPEAVPEPATWTDPSLSGGGYGQAQLCHALGFALWLADARVESAYAILGKGAFPDAPVELHDAVALTYEGGAIGTMSGASCHIGAYNNKHGLEMRAMGSEGQAAVDLERDWIWLYRPDGTDLQPDLPEDAGLYNCIGPDRRAGRRRPGAARAQLVAGRAGRADGRGARPPLQERAQRPARVARLRPRAVVRVGIDSYAYHRLLGEVRPGEEPPPRAPFAGYDGVIAEAHRLGVDVLSLETNVLPPPAEVDVAALAERTAPAELVLAHGHPQGLRFGRDAQQAADLQAWIAGAADAGLPLVRMVVGGPWARLDEPSAGFLPRVLDALRPPVTLAGQRGVALALENHADLTLDEMDEVLDELDAPHLGVCFDTSNWVRVGDDPVDAARRLAGRVRIVHLKDHVARPDDGLVGPRSVALGTGEVDLAGVLEPLLAADPDAAGVRGARPPRTGAGRDGRRGTGRGLAARGGGAPRGRREGRLTWSGTSRGRW